MHRYEPPGQPSQSRLRADSTWQVYLRKMNQDKQEVGNYMLNFPEDSLTFQCNLLRHYISFINCPSRLWQLEYITFHILGTPEAFTLGVQRSVLSMCWYFDTMDTSPWEKNLEQIFCLEIFISTSTCYSRSLSQIFLVRLMSPEDT